MSKPEYNINLPWQEAVRRSFSFVLAHPQALYKIGAAWFLLGYAADILSGFTSICTQDNCPTNVWSFIYGLLTYLGGISISVAYINYVISRQAPQNKIYLSFGKRELKYFWYSFQLICMVLFPAIIIGFIWTAMVTRGAAEAIDVKLYTLISVFLLMIYFSRFILVLPAAAMADETVDFKRSYLLSQGNANKIFWGLLIISLPVSLTGMLLFELYRFWGSESLVFSLLFSAAQLGLYVLDTALKASFFAHIYQYFLYFSHKQDSASVSRDEG